MDRDERGTTRIARKKAIGMEELIEQYIKEMKLAAGLNCQCIFEAWDEVTGAARYTIGRFFRDGKLYITLNSSVVRNQLYFQKAAIIEKINARLRQDSLFTPEEGRNSYVNELILK